MSHFAFDIFTRSYMKPPTHTWPALSTRIVCGMSARSISTIFGASNMHFVLVFLSTWPGEIRKSDEFYFFARRCRSIFVFVVAQSRSLLECCVCNKAKFSWPGFFIAQNKKKKRKRRKSFEEVKWFFFSSSSLRIHPEAQQFSFHSKVKKSLLCNLFLLEREIYGFVSASASLEKLKTFLRSTFSAKAIN